MAAFLTVVVVGNALVFSTLAVLGVRTALRDPSPRLRTLAWVLSAVAAAFVLGSATRLAALAVRQGWLPGQLGDFLISEWLLAQALAASALGVGGLLVIRRVAEPIRAADRIVTALGERMPVETPVSQLGLTTRELDVLAVLSQGRTSDREIAEDLFISPATAGTHVKNIMRKAGVRSRRELMLLALRSPEEAPTGTR